MYVWRTTYIIAEQEIIVPAVVGGILSVLLGASPSLCRGEVKGNYGAAVSASGWGQQITHSLSLCVCVCKVYIIIVYIRTCM